jgi:hypothetical protein
MRFRYFTPLAFALMSLAASAQLYSWKDANGKIHYSDEPPPDAKAQTHKVAPPATGAGDPDARRAAVEREAEARKKQKEAQEAAGKADKEKADSQERRANCEQAKTNLKAIESGQIRFTMNSAGEKVGLDGAVREAEIAKARKTVDTWCK